MKPGPTTTLLNSNAMLWPQNGAISYTAYSTKLWQIACPKVF